MADYENGTCNGMEGGIAIISPFVCGFCKTDFRSFQKFYIHLKSHDVNINKFFHVCGSQGEEEDIQTHQMIFCNCCSCIFNSICHLHNHLVGCDKGGSYIYVHDKKIAYPLGSLDEFTYTNARSECPDTESNVESSVIEEHGNASKDLDEIVIENGKSSLHLRERKTFKQFRDASTNTSSLELNLEIENKVLFNDREGLSSYEPIDDNDKCEYSAEMTSKLNSVTIESNETFLQVCDESFHSFGIKKSSNNLQANDWSIIKPKEEKSISRVQTGFKKEQVTNDGAESSCHDVEICDKVTDEMEENLSNSLEKQKQAAGDNVERFKSINRMIKNKRKGDEGKVGKQKLVTLINKKTGKRKHVANKNPRIETRGRKRLPRETCNKCGIEVQKRNMDLHKKSHDNPTEEKRGRKKGQKNKIHLETCSICHEKVNKHHLKFHERIHSNPPKTKGREKVPLVECSICGKELQRYRLEHHMISHSSVRPYKCDLCLKTYKYEKHLVIHKRSHSNVLPYYCEVCGHGFIEIARLNMHVLTHSDVRPFSCEVCGAGFYTKNKLNRHAHVHTGTKRTQCDLCGMTFANRDNLSTHIAGVHKGEKRFPCLECDKRFFTKYLLKCHTMKHAGVRPHKCTLCTSDFIERKELRRHMLKQHNTALDEKTSSGNIKVNQVNNDNGENYHQETSLNFPSNSTLQNLEPNQTFGELNGEIHSTIGIEADSEQSRLPEIGEQMYIKIEDL